MLSAVGVSIYLISKDLGITSFTDMVSLVSEDPRSQIFDWNWKSGTNFFKQFASGAFITIVMTGLDQDMMQKNLTCMNIGEEKYVLVYHHLGDR